MTLTYQMENQKKTRIYRIIHIDNLRVLLNREGLYAPNNEPKDSQTYRPIHDLGVQRRRKSKQVPIGPKGSLHDYVPFYFGIHSPMLFRLHTGRVEGYNEGQNPIIYLVAHAENFAKGQFVFSDGHGVTHLTKWYDDANDLDKIDWNTINQKIWRDTADDNDRERRKQAEFLVHKVCDWSKIRGICVINQGIQEQVKNILSSYPSAMHKPVVVNQDWYY